MLQFLKFELETWKACLLKLTFWLISLRSFSLFVFYVFYVVDLYKFTRFQIKPKTRFITWIENTSSQKEKNIVIQRQFRHVICYRYLFKMIVIHFLLSVFYDCFYYKTVKWKVRSIKYKIWQIKTSNYKKTIFSN